MRPFVHYGIHFLVPPLVAFLFYRSQFTKATLIMYAAFLIDLDHLWANPIFDPNRCSIGHHFLHTIPAILVYGISTLWKPTRLIGLGLIIHILADSADCALL
ncbi:DUF6122 family protein [Sediminicola luteus]|uniref:Metal-dependent hydrolase n=1 Tax=Sediminicola luteus TaxID=319238 RepID=A0A2A4G8S3_9FLAO|nr:DUF6122 family protein [Sediminicola luteus]PCE64833.1 hypothetical protein B7P33_06600 [Sediminicola luteus]